MITLYVGVGCTLGGMIIGYAFRGKEHAMIADVVKTAMTEWHAAQNKVSKFVGGVETGIKKL